MLNVPSMQRRGLRNLMTRATWTIGLLCLLVVCGSATVGLSRTVDLANNEADLTVFSRDQGDRLGNVNSLATGDFNDDGRVDLLIGAPGGDGPEETRSNAGEVYVILDRNNLPDRINVDDIPRPDKIFFGQRGDHLGTAVASGDVNGDGIDDIIMGAPGDNEFAYGRIYVIFGGASIPSSRDFSNANPDLIIGNNSLGTALGSSVLSTDLNGDGIDDIVIGDPVANGPGSSRPNAGNVYVINGGTDLPSSITLGLNGYPDTVIYGINSNDLMGTSLASADVNRDGMGDLLLGAPEADGPSNGRSNGGEAYLIFGRSSWPDTLDLNSVSADTVFFGRDAGDQLGYAVAAGDVNRDGRADVVLGAPEANGPNNARGSGGEVLVFFGESEMPSVVDARDDDIDSIIYGAQRLDKLGTSVSAGDFNGDGVADVAMGAPDARGDDAGAQAGRAYVIHGQRNWRSTFDLDDRNADDRFFGANRDDHLGSAIALGSGTDDGRAMLLIGAVGFDAPGDGNRAGVVYLFTGSRGGDIDNRAPTARAGSDRTVNIETEVRLDGRDSSDPDDDPLTFDWSFVSRPDDSTASLSNADAERPTFRPDVSGDYVIELRVEDTFGAGDTDRVTIRARDAGNTPTARAGSDRTVPPETEVELDGSGSSDPNGDPLTFEWRFVSRPSGSQAELADAGSERPTFTADAVGQYVIELTVEDPDGNADSDRVQITAQACAPGDVDCDGDVDIDDARLVCEAILGTRTLTEGERERADVNGDGQLTLEDAQWIAEAAVGKRELSSNSSGTSGSSASPETLSVLNWTAMQWGSTAIRFQATGVGVQSLDVQVYDLAGRLVYAQRTAGQQLTWNLQNAQEQQVANGVYVYVLRAHGAEGAVAHSGVRKLVVLR